MYSPDIPTMEWGKSTPYLVFPSFDLIHVSIIFVKQLFNRSRCLPGPAGMVGVQVKLLDRKFAGNATSSFGASELARCNAIFLRWWLWPRIGMFRGGHSGHSHPSFYSPLRSVLLHCRVMMSPFGAKSLLALRHSWWCTFLANLDFFILILTW